MAQQASLLRDARGFLPGPPGIFPGSGGGGRIGLAEWVRNGCGMGVGMFFEWVVEWEGLRHGGEEGAEAAE